MAGEHVQQAAKPPVALTRKRSQGFGRFGEGHGFGGELHAGDVATLVGGPSKAHDQLHVLADGVVLVAAHLEQRVAPEQAERAADDEVASERAPGDAADEERARVLHCLRADQGTPWCPQLDDPPVAPLGVIHQANGATDGDRRTIRQERSNELLECVAGNQGVCVDRAHQVARCHVQRRVQRIGLAAVVLVHDDQAVVVG